MAAKTKVSNEYEIAVHDLFAASKRGLEAWTQASQIYADGAHALVKRQSEMVNGYLADYVATLQSVMLNAEPLDEKQAGKRVDQAKVAYETGLANAQELYGIAMKANNEALDVLSRAFMAQFDQVTAAMRAGTKTVATQ